MEIEERRRREREQREESILASAERLFFSRGYVSVTMDEIAREAGFTKRTVYAYVKSKERLALAISLRGYRLLNAAIASALSAPQPSGFGRFTVVAGAILDFVRDSGGYFDVITDYSPPERDFTEGDELALACYQEGERPMSELRAAIERGIEDGSIRRDVEPLRITFLLWALLVGYRRILRLKGAYLSSYHPEAEGMRSNLLSDIELLLKA